MENDPQFTSLSPSPKIGDLAPDFQFTLTSGKTLTLQELTDRSIVLLNFIKGTWCPYCQQHMRNLRKWGNSLSITKSLTILVLSNEPIENLRSWASENNIDYLLGTFKDSEILRSYGIDIENHSFPKPATVLIEKNRKIRFVHLEARTEDLQSQLNRSFDT